MFKTIALSLGLGVGLASAASAATVTVDVDAYYNSTSGGTGVSTGVILTAGESFSVSADVNDTWSLGPNDPGCTRESNPDGLTACYGDWTQNGLSALFGSLVGQINGGDFFLIGSDFNGVAAESGELLLFAFDSDNINNSGSIEVTITTPDTAAVPLPAAGLLLLGGLGGLGLLRRRKTA